MTIRRFREIVWKHAALHGRGNLPWRKRAVTPYQVLVSEIMLQQTQVDRVIPFYRTFCTRFPTVRALADAPLAGVLSAWQGLGYNRRAKLLHEAAKTIAREYRGRMPRTVEELKSLPGIGPYTAGAIAAFAYNADTVFVETNLRTAIIHHFYPDKEKVSDEEVLSVLARALPAGQARDWYAALMDYGAYLKRSGVRTNIRSKGYAKQKAFAGSNREARGALLRELTKGPRTSRALTTLLGTDRKAQLAGALATLRSEGFVELREGRYQLHGEGRVSGAHS